MKKLFSFVCALVCAMSLSARDLYLVIGHSDWQKNNERFAVYAFSSGEKWYDMTAVDGATNTYKATIEDTHSQVIFCRMSGTSTTNNWDNKWNQTIDLTLPTNTNENCYTVDQKSGDKYSGTWSVYSAGGEGGEGGGSTDPDPVVYSIKHGWKDGQDGSWSYKKLTPNGNGTYSIRDIYGGTGCYWKSSVSSDEKWIGSPTLVGSPAVGDSAIFTLTSTTGDGAITITKIATTGGEGEGGEGGEGGGSTDPDPATTYYMKHGWNDGTTWTWKALTANSDGTYSIRDIYGGGGCDWNTKKDDDGKKYLGNPTLVGNPAKGDSAIFTLTSTEGDGAITITKIVSAGGEGGEGGEGGGSTEPSVTEYWYFDQNNTKWDGTIDDKWKMTVSGDIAYVQVPAGKANKFKIFPCNPKVDDKVLANDDNIAEGTLVGDIELSKDTEKWKNILISATNTDYFVVLYLPNTATNSSEKYLVAAMTQLPNSGSDPTSLSNTEVENAAVKVIRNGQVLIVREGVTYNMMGQTIQ